MSMKRERPMSVCMIPARSGSKRVPKKNIKEFAGMPLIAYSINAAKASGQFDRIIVSTDCQEVANISMAYGAEVPFMRPKELSDDYATTLAVIVHCVDWLRESGCDVKYLCCFYATAPMVSLRPAFISEVKNAMIKHEAPAGICVVPANCCIFRSFKLVDGSPVMFWPENYPKRSQEFDQAYADAAQFYWVDTDYLHDADFRLFHPQAKAVAIPSYFVQDIDTPEDFHEASVKYLLLKGLIESKQMTIPEYEDVPTTACLENCVRA